MKSKCLFVLALCSLALSGCASVGMAGISVVKQDQGTTPPVTMQAAASSKSAS